MKFKIYKITILETSKVYIGYTSKTIEERFKKHKQNTTDGIKTKFYNALRKYGFDNLEIIEICCTDNFEMAKELEKYYIERFNSYKKGYNSTIGGEGGWIIGQLPKEQQQEYFAKKSILATGINNPNSCGLSDEQIIEYGVKFYLEENMFNISKWYIFAEKFNLPKSFSKNRFNGEKVVGFKKRIAEKLGLKELNKYKITKEHKEKLSFASSQQKWYTNGVKNILITPKKTDLEKEIIANGYYRGRV